MHISNKCSIAVHCLIFIHEFGKERKVTSEMMSMSTGCNPVTVRNIVSALKKDGIIDVKPGTGGATVSAPLKDIDLYRICRAVEPEAIDNMMGVHSNPSAFCPIGRKIKPVLSRTYSKIQGDLIESMKKINMEQILREYRSQKDR